MRLPVLVHLWNSFPPCYLVVDLIVSNADGRVGSSVFQSASFSYHGHHSLSSASVFLKILCVENRIQKKVRSSGLRSYCNVTSVHLITIICKFRKATSDSKILYRVHDVSCQRLHHVEKQNVYGSFVKRMKQLRGCLTFIELLCGSEAGAIIVNSSRGEGRYCVRGLPQLHNKVF